MFSVQSFYVSTACSAAYGTLCVFILIQARQRTNFLLAACCGVTSFWAGLGSAWPDGDFGGLIGAIDIARMLAWYGYLFSLYIKTEIATRWHIRGFGGIALLSTFLMLLIAFTSSSNHAYSLLSFPIIVRLMISISALLLVENLYFNLPEYARWHVAIPCVLLGGVACFDILVAADAVLFHAPSGQLASTRMVVLAAVAPLLVLAASRGERWSEPVRLSRTAVFHSATLVLSGSVLLALAFAGELLRRFNSELGWVAELSLVSLGFLGLFLFLSSRSARSVIQRVVVRHFFADRYDYRLQWLRCISTLSGTGSLEKTHLSTRAIRAVADVVDSPNGSLFIFDQPTSVMSWSGSWNMPTGSALSRQHQLVQDLSRGLEVLEFDGLMLPGVDSSGLGQLGPIWLATPLIHDAGVIGMVVVGPPRTPFHLDQEVLDLLRIVGREVATYLAEQQAAESIIHTRDLHDYGQRFAFVAHDIKNVSSQLALLLANAEQHLTNPEFQKDMIQTVKASVNKIDALLKRLNQGSTSENLNFVNPQSLLGDVVLNYSQGGSDLVLLSHDNIDASVQISREDFTAAVSHLINNAIEAGSLSPVEVCLSSESGVVIIDIIDHGRGMSADFIRDELFTPLRTTKFGGSGIGAYQARELLRNAGGQLLVTSAQGVGSTMRIKLPKADDHGRAINERMTLSTIGD